MCHKLLQVYCCGHTNEVCTTPCAHALSTAIPGPGPSSTEAPDTPTSLHRQEAQQLARHGSGRSTTTSNGTTPGNTSSPPRLSLNFTPPLRSSSVASLPPPPYSTSISTSTYPSSPTNHPEPSPNLCAQFFARYLPAGNHPCYECYMNPAYANLRARWMRMYAEGHPGVKMEDLEKLSGVEGVAKALGLVNVQREVNTAHMVIAEGREAKAAEGEATVEGG